MNISKLFWQNIYHKITLDINVRTYAKKINPAVKTWEVLSNDLPDFFNRKKKTLVYPEHVDIVIIGGGFIGSATAYWLKNKAGDGLSIAVLEKDFTYQQTQNNYSLGMLHQHFSLPENIQLSQFSADFLRNIKTNLGKDVDIQYKPHGYLVLGSEKYADKLEETVTIQRENSVKNELLSVEEINARYPWINTNDIRVGCIGLESEGVFNSWSFLKGLVQKSQELGTMYINAEVTGFELEKQRDVLMEGIAPGTFERINKVIYKTQDNEEHAIKFAACILAAGVESGNIAKLAKIGVSDGLLSVPLPIVDRKHTIYSIEDEENHTGLNTPIVMDTSGLWLRRNGLEKHLIFGQIPFLRDENQKISEDEYYKDIIEPSLNNRFPNTKGKKIRNLASEIQDFNNFDESGFLGPHPYHNNLYLAAGFGQYGCQLSPGIGRAIAELIIDSQYISIDLTRLGFDRILTSQPLMEFNVY